MTKADITGLMAKPKPGWEERVELLARPELFNGYTPKAALLAALDEEERSRLFVKLRLVKEFASFLAAGMVKGTIKYASDAYSVDQWMAHLIGEGADQANYQMLLFDAWRKKHEQS